MHARLITAAFVLASSFNYAIAQDLDFSNLPGVVQQTGPSVSFEDTGSQAKPECTTAFEVYGTESNVPKRVYKCKKGNITITSDEPPEGY
ncbi:hypothetical protein SAMN05877838_1287 [Hoeflea halophila]|uniref:Uncharacterized protein n=2 Tax=Hoeflea halophila TaxID=714899 RepID=A0A286I8K5_9HYPH|nr:hypothetical protein SAMN05877838_1287 [Hoeflea halophila]